MKAIFPSRKKERVPEAARAAILQAAAHEFAREGEAGARIDQIARLAGVNKALLYYYFKDKDSLHGAVLDGIFSGLLEKVFAALKSGSTPRQQIMAYVGAHFDYIASSPNYPRLIQWEMMRAGRDGRGHLQDIVHRYMQPLFNTLIGVIEEGKSQGEFRAVDARQFVPSMISVIVAYFLMRPTLEILMKTDPLAPALVAERRRAVMDFLEHALFAPQSPRLQSRRGKSVKKRDRQ